MTPHSQSPFMVQLRNPSSTVVESLLKTGTSVTGPMAALGVNKFYLAGASTAAKYYSLGILFKWVSSSPSAITSWALETYPMTRI
jgi:hypothetical protein